MGLSNIVVGMYLGLYGRGWCVGGGLHTCTFIEVS